jgi:hypothetical protein
MNWIIYTMLALAVVILAVSTMIIVAAAGSTPIGRWTRRWLPAVRCLPGRPFAAAPWDEFGAAAGDQGFGARLDAKGREIESADSVVAGSGQGENAPGPPLSDAERSVAVPAQLGAAPRKAGRAFRRAKHCPAQLLDRSVVAMAGRARRVRVELLLVDRCGRGLVRNYACRLAGPDRMSRPGPRAGDERGGAARLFGRGQGAPDVPGGARRDPAQSGQRGRRTWAERQKRQRWRCSRWRG